MSVKKRSNTEWRALVAECEASGMTHQEWCLANQVNYYTYCDRARRLRRIDEEGDPGRAMFTAKPKREWVELKEQDSGRIDSVVVREPEHKPDERNRGEIHIIVGSFTVAVTDDFNDAAFMRVLNALSSVCGQREAARVC